MLVEETKKSARIIFEQWLPFFGSPSEVEDKERLFEYFHSGYLAGTRHRDRKEKSGSGPLQSLVHDDINRNLDL
jgi:hypothetical protein